jgi:hypothetical protein
MDIDKYIYPALLAAMIASPATAGEWEFTGYLGVDSRAFWQDASFEGQDDGVNLSVIAQPEFYWRSDSGSKRVSIIGFARADSQDAERSHLDLREAYWGIDGQGWDMTVGINKVFWGVTESRHLVDVINQTDLVEDIDQEAKLGQPMINFNVDRDFGRFGFFVLPYFRERTFPGADGRMRSPIPVDTGDATYESPAEESHVDFALRYSHYFGDVDVGAYLFEGTSREPWLDVAPSGDRLIPVYEQMTQLGLDLQYTRNAWLWKLETIYRDANSDSFVAAVGGFEYTLYGVSDSAADFGFLVEYLYDDRNEHAPPTAFDNDVFVGGRFALNDASDTSVLAGVAVDPDTGELFVNVEAERRIGDSLGVELRLRAFANAEANDSLYSIESDDYLQLRLNWYY